MAPHASAAISSLILSIRNRNCWPPRPISCGAGTSPNCAVPPSGLYFYLYVILDVFRRLTVTSVQPNAPINIEVPELVKKPKDLLEYVVVHEMLHLIAPTHSEQFLALISKHYPAWRAARAELNELPLASESWKE
jgi:hypothetical protein